MFSTFYLAMLRRCIDCKYLRYSRKYRRWECSKPGWQIVISDPAIPRKCSFFIRKKGAEKPKVSVLA